MFFKGLNYLPYLPFLLTSQKKVTWSNNPKIVAWKVIRESFSD
jgi:hypothetical protein